MYDDPVSRALAVIRQHYDDGGDVEPLMSRVIEGVGDRAIRDKRVLEPEAVLKPGPEQSVWEKISSKFMGDRPSPERRRFVEGMGNIADVAHMGAYATPLAPAMGAVDFARGVASGDPTEAVLGATGLPGRAAKAAGVAASAMMPGEAEAGPLQRALNAIRAYHGSPHQFDKFDISKIGTGEGNAAYGHGINLSGSEDIAKKYRDIQGRASFDPMLNVAHKLMLAGDDPMQTLPSIFPHGSESEFLAAIERAKNPERGHMYEVDIHANPEHLLDWHKPLKEQSEHVKKALTPIGLGLSEGGPQGAWNGRIGWADKSGRPLGRVTTGAKRPINVFEEQDPGFSIYRQLGRDEKDQAAKTLQEIGIPGVKYRDQRSFGIPPENQISNYVIFDPSLIEILRRYKDGGYVE